MSDYEELYESRSLELDKEMSTMFSLFKYHISTETGTRYFTDEYQIEEVIPGRVRITLHNAWFNEHNTNRRIVPKVTIVVDKYEIIELQ